MEIAVSPLLPEALLVDLPEVDAQHEEIFTCIESIKSACFESTHVPIDELQALIALFERHFSTEERLAREAGLDFADHARIHRETIRLLRKGLDDILTGEHDTHPFLRYAEYWFERHIKEDDKEFAATLQSRSFNLPVNRWPAVSHSLSARA